MTTLVTGATGNIGRLVVDHLVAAGVSDVRALTVNPAKAQLPESVEAVRGFLGRPETLPAAFEGVERVYLAPFTRTLPQTLDALRDAGVQYVVALSGGAHWTEHADAVSASGIPHTQLGPGEFCENFLAWADEIAADRTVREAYPMLAEAPVSMNDIARVAATLLADPADEHLSAMYELTGPESLTRARIAEEIGAGLGISVSMEQVSRDDALARLTETMGREAAEWYLDLQASGLDRPQAANTLVGDITGRPAESIAEWAARNADAFEGARP